MYNCYRGRVAGIRGIYTSGPFALVPVIVLLSAMESEAMHIAEGILPLHWAGIWYLLAIPFCIRGLHVLRQRSAADPLFKPLVGIVGAAVFVFSCMPIPVPIAGTCAHPVGAGLAAILIGPSLTVVISGIALLFQALFLAHGGLTTLGANMVSMGVAGAFAGYGMYKAIRYFGGSIVVAAFCAGAVANWATYGVTAVELALGLADGNFFVLLRTILIAFVPTQLPLGILEGIVSAGAVKFILDRRPAMIGKEAMEVFA